MRNIERFVVHRMVAPRGDNEHDFEVMDTDRVVTKRLICRASRADVILIADTLNQRFGNEAHA